jgi:diguanylate cyclase (GGDEF)-like protein
VSVRARPTLLQVEPVIPVVLGLHGLLIGLLGTGLGWPSTAFAAVTALGLAGVVGWQTSTARLVRAAACTLTPLVLSVGDPTLVPVLLQWYYCVTAVYCIVIANRAVSLLGPLAGCCYLLQVASGAVPVPWAVALLRAGVLSALGLATWTAGLALRRSAQDAEEGRAAAEAARTELEHAATHDDLTGLPNRTLFHRGLAEQLDLSAPAALLLLDLDRFKEVNDTLGHRYGDTLLAQVGARLTSLMGPKQLVARLGGDEFAVHLPCADEQAALAFAGRLREVLQEPFQVHEALIAIDASIGISLAPVHAVDGDRLLQLADVAMYTAKGSGSGSSVYDPASDRHTADQLVLLAELRGAVAAGQLVVEYQPQVDALTCRPVGMEALVRWEHPTRGRIMPDVFIPLAERSGIIRPLTALVLDTALEQCRSWRDAGERLTVAINLSARNLQQDDLVEQVRFALHRHRLPAQALELEITESFLMADPHRARQLLTELHELGVTLAIDDFGTGLSSLSYLKNLPVQVLKIDKSFVKHLVRDPSDGLIVRGVVDLATGLGLRTVAEGVEDLATLQHLTALGCTYAQGYYLSRPLPAADVVAWCRAGMAASAS